MLLDSVNSFHPSIQFTCERDSPVSAKGNENSINFLDMTIFRSHTDNNINTCWYKKPYSSGRILNFLSNHTKSTIKGVALNLMNNILTLSSPRYRVENIRSIFEILDMNNYPVYFITRLLSQTLIRDKPDRTRDVSHVPLTYSQILFDNIKGIMGDFFPGISLCGRPDNSNFQYNFSRIKDKEPTSSKQNCVVQLSCEKCKRLYIASTQYDHNVSDLIKGICNPRRSHDCSHILNKSKLKITSAKSHTKTRILLSYVHSKHSNSILSTDVQPRNFPLYKFVQEREDPR